jgi:hypothetical protein
MTTERMEGTAVDELVEDAAEVLIVEQKKNNAEFRWWRNLALYHVKRWNCDLKVANHSPSAWYIYIQGVQRVYNNRTNYGSE